MIFLKYLGQNVNVQMPVERKPKETEEMNIEEPRMEVTKKNMFQKTRAKRQLVVALVVVVNNYPW